MKLARRGGEAEAPERKSLGERVVGSEEIKSLLRTKRGKASMEFKAIISAATADAMGAAGDLIEPDRRAGLIAPQMRRLTVRDLLMPGTTDSNSIQYVRETGWTNNAATVSEITGALKPQSDIKFDITSSAVTTIAHWVQATRQILDDAAQLRSYIDGRLRYGLAYVEELQLLLGGGTGTDLAGIYTLASAYSAPITISGATPIDVLRLMILQSTLAELPASGIVLNPADWARVELTRETSGGYIFANPTAVTQPRLWGLPIVATTAMPVDSALVGAFNMGAQVFDRMEARVEVSTEDSDNFRRNLVTILAEERLALAVYRPEAFIKADLGFVA
jgi:HK97 family phage major capsid protein